MLGAAGKSARATCLWFSGLSFTWSTTITGIDRFCFTTFRPSSLSMTSKAEMPLGSEGSAAAAG
jgi:hypothetical protein